MAIEDEVLWFQVSVDNSFGVQVGEGFHNTASVEPCGRVFKRTPKMYIFNQILVLSSVYFILSFNWEFD